MGDWVRRGVYYRNGDGRFPRIIGLRPIAVKLAGPANNVFIGGLPGDDAHPVNACLGNHMVILMNRVSDRLFILIGVVCGAFAFGVEGTWRLLQGDQVDLGFLLMEVVAGGIMGGVSGRIVLRWVLGSKNSQDGS